MPFAQCHATLPSLCDAVTEVVALVEVNGQSAPDKNFQCVCCQSVEMHAQALYFDGGKIGTATQNLPEAIQIPSG